MLACGSRHDLKHCAQHHHVADTRIAQLMRNLRKRHREHAHVFAHAFGRNLFAVVDEPTAGRTVLSQFYERRFIHRDQNTWRRHQGRIDGLTREAHVAIRRARAHLRPVRRAAMRLQGPRPIPPRPAPRPAAGRPVRQTRRHGFAGRWFLQPDSMCRASPADASSSATPRIAGISSSAGDGSSSGRGCASFVRSQKTPSG